MMNIEDTLRHFTTQENKLGERARLAEQYHVAMKAGELSRDEYQELMNDLKKIEIAESAATELDQAIALNAVIDALMKLPI